MARSESQRPGSDMTMAPPMTAPTMTPAVASLESENAPLESRAARFGAGDGDGDGAATAAGARRCGAMRLCPNSRTAVMKTIHC